MGFTLGRHPRESGSRNNPDVVTTHSHGSSGTNWSETQSWQQAGRKLLKPEEVQSLSDRAAITFTQGVPPIMTRLVRWYEAGQNLPRRASLKASLGLLMKSLLLAGDLDVPGIGGGTIPGVVRTHERKPPVLEDTG
ncbi:MAG: type IV secretory system conjugative DNA transfer family protein, partial [Gemmataceae bacterium]|nr:type IV secretory system conjugative DNA transfer family protein [Gemmataceae bacterium]